MAEVKNPLKSASYLAVYLGKDDIFLDVRKYGWEGVFKINNEKWKAIQGQNNLKNKRTKKIFNDDEACQQLELWDL